MDKIYIDDLGDADGLQEQIELKSYAPMDEHILQEVDDAADTVHGAIGWSFHLLTMFAQIDGGIKRIWIDFSIEPTATTVERALAAW